jgi:hypothetical protein
MGKKDLLLRPPDKGGRHLSRYSVLPDLTGGERTGIRTPRLLTWCHAQTFTSKEPPSFSASITLAVMICPVLSSHLSRRVYPTRSRG